MKKINKKIATTLRVIHVSTAETRSTTLLWKLHRPFLGKITSLFPAINYFSRNRTASVMHSQNKANKDFQRVAKQNIKVTEIDTIPLGQIKCGLQLEQNGCWLKCHKNATLAQSHICCFSLPAHNAPLNPKKATVWGGDRNANVNNWEKKPTSVMIFIFSCGFCCDFSTSADLWKTVNAFV